MGQRHCRCRSPHGRCRLVVLTGGPGAGKTAVLEVVRQHFCRHVAVLPEAAGIVFGGGFPRRADEPARRAAQRSIFHVQAQLERMTLEDGDLAVALCDRGTLDGVAYWPGGAESFWVDLGTTRAEQHARYAAVIHLRVPALRSGYDHSNPLRVESPEEAAAIDARIARAWDGHARRTFVDSTESFVDKLRGAIESIRAELPSCCAEDLER